MDIQFYLGELLDSDAFKKFKLKHNEAYLCSAFFSIDGQGNDNQQHFDFCIPSERKIVGFQIEKNFEQINLADCGEKMPEKLGGNFDFDFDEIEELITKKMKEGDINKQIQKILFSLQSQFGKNFLIGTIFISGMGLLKVIIDLEKKEITEFEKKSFFDIFKIVKK